MLSQPIISSNDGFQLSFDKQAWALSQLGDQIRPLITGFLHDLGYVAPLNLLRASKDSALWSGMCEYADQSGVSYDEGSFSWQCFLFGATYAAWCFPDHPHDAKVYVGVYTWLAIVLDDEVSQPENIVDAQRFVERYTKREAQPTPILEAWADVCRLAYKHYDPVIASIITIDSLKFVNANVLEGREEFKRINPSDSGMGMNWPWYLRDMDGVAEAYAYLTWPKEKYPDMSYFMEMMCDLKKFICLTNDILSFYKEEKAGDLTNYINNRARHEGKGKTSVAVLKEVIDEAIETAHRMEAVLRVKGREMHAEALRKFISGYIGFHIKNGRYKLWEIGLTEPDETI